MGGNLTAVEIEKSFQLLIKSNIAVKLNFLYLSVRECAFYCCLCQVNILYTSDGSNLINHCLSLGHNQLLEKNVSDFMNKIKAESVVNSSLGCLQKYQKALASIAENFPFNKITSHTKLISIKNNMFYCNTCNKSIQFTNEALKVQKHFENIHHVVFVYNNTFTGRLKIEQENVTLPSASIKNNAAGLELKETKTAAACEQMFDDIGCNNVLKNLFGDEFELLDSTIKEVISRNIIYLEIGENCFFCTPCHKRVVFGKEIRLHTLVSIGSHLSGKRHEQKLSKWKAIKDCLPKQRRKPEKSLSEEESSRLHLVLESNKSHLLIDQKTKMFYCLLCKFLIGKEEKNASLVNAALHCDGKFHQWNLRKLSLGNEMKTMKANVSTDESESVYSNNSTKEKENITYIFYKVIEENSQHIVERNGEFLCLLCKTIIDVDGEETYHSLQKVALHCETKDHKSKRRKSNSLGIKKKNCSTKQETVSFSFERTTTVDELSKFIESKDNEFYCSLCNTSIITCDQERNISLAKVAQHCSSKGHKRRHNKLNYLAEKEIVDLNNQLSEDLNIEMSSEQANTVVDTHNSHSLNDTNDTFQDNQYISISDLFRTEL